MRHETQRISSLSLSRFRQGPAMNLLYDMETANIREANSSDIAMITDVIRKSYATVAKRYHLSLENCPKHPSNCTVEWVESDIARGVTYFVIEADNTIFGCMACEKASAETCYLERLAVLPERRNRGAGYRLVHYFFNRAATLGFHKIGIGIIATQQDLKEWYQKLGFVETGTKSFAHLPFAVCFMEISLSQKEEQP